MNQGYLHPCYAESFLGFGEPRGLESSGGWILERAIPGAAARDAMGLYPLFCCRDWTALRRDLELEGARWVSLALVADPFGEYDRRLLERTFDIVQPYKEHFVADTSVPLEAFVSSSHRSNARRALRKVEVEVCEEPARFMDDWVALFDVLARRHDIHGLRAFSRAAFERQLRVPGLVMFRAVHGGRTVGLDLWYVQDDVAQGHLVAFNDEGYALSASYATKWTLLNYFAGRVRWVNFGGLPGSADPSTGLGHFKRGWSNTTRKAYFCGSIFDHQAYERLAGSVPQTSFFPAYRAGEN
ncbi:GNAT family N-acetyltransferase [Billgrantia lactosivorans]|uniref:GNAT family N-acetyltransferase n=1 Tax=Billgrantia lactosivorans TaxID=2185141 RepID=UPI000DAEF898|nr:GNAT family N-acetyltransferase [Halomonas lactosivorans]